MGIPEPHSRSSVFSEPLNDNLLIIAEIASIILCCAFAADAFSD
jgi:hypothetical protein